MKSYRLESLSPEEITYLRKVREIHGVWLNRTKNRVIVNDRKGEAFLVELLILDDILSH